MLIFNDGRIVFEDHVDGSIKESCRYKKGGLYARIGSPVAVLRIDHGCFWIFLDSNPPTPSLLQNNPIKDSKHFDTSEALCVHVDLNTEIKSVSTQSLYYSLIGIKRTQLSSVSATFFCLSSSTANNIPKGK